MGWMRFYGFYGRLVSFEKVFEQLITLCLLHSSSIAASVYTQIPLSSKVPTFTMTSTPAGTRTPPDIRTLALQTPVDVAEYLFTRLHQMGVRSIHGLPGDYNLVALDYIPKLGLNWVGNVNELNAGKS